MPDQGSAEFGLIPLPDGGTDGETVPADEKAALATIVQVIESRVRQAVELAPARRDAHPKAHGCVRAEFQVLDDVPDLLRAGIFAEPRCYQAIIRFSNGAGTPQADGVGDGRGMAIKLMDVGNSRSTTQDFILINNPTFFVRNASDYVSFQTANPPWRFFLPGWNPLNFRLHELLVARAITSRKVTNPLSTQYWSMTPYLCGNRVAKFSAKPVGPRSGFVDTTSENFLHDNMAKHLAAGAAEFIFMVQAPESQQGLPIEDPTIEWLESAAPFVQVARITIPSQSFDDPEQQAMCENLSFSPWHGLDAHRPLGGINRVRRTVYEAISRVRHELNGVPRIEPRTTEIYK